MQERSRNFGTNPHNGYWWHRLKGSDYVPPVYAGLSDYEWLILQQWFDDTEQKFPSPGEVSIPGISFLSGLIGGSAISSIVQCGHFVGYSSLMLGFLFRKMGKKNALFSIDIDPVPTRYTQDWIERAGLQEYVKLSVASSSDPAMVEEARAFHGSSPHLVFIDSSHRYAHTLEELDLWWEALKPGGLIVLHDISVFAQQFVGPDDGGVLRAVREWSEKAGVQPFLMNQFVDGGTQPADLTYKDGCGLGLLQKPLTG